MPEQSHVHTPPPDLDWIQLRKDYADLTPETSKEKMVRKIKENPLVPIGKFHFQLLNNRMMTNYFSSRLPGHCRCPVLRPV
jgi:hypothetical protein